MSADHLDASFQNGKFHIEWKFQSSEHDLQSYDRIEVREKNGGHEDITSAVQVTQSSLSSDRILIRPVAPLNMADGQYYAVYISSKSEKEIARSKIFTASNLAARSFDEEFLVDNEDCIINVVQVHPVNVPGKENCEIDIEWKFKSDTGDLLTKTDYICIVPVKKKEDLKNVYQDHAFGLASGRPTGKVSIQLGGYVEVDHKYQAFYLLNHQMKGLLCKGASDPFVIDDSMLPYFDNPAATKASSQQFNMSTNKQYTTQSQMETLKATKAYNPLLSITPKEDKWSKLIEQAKNDHEEVEDQLLVHLDDIKANEDDNVVDIDDFINENRMTKQITATLRSKKCFLFAGAGISMAAPSSVPSWGKLMSDVIEETFKAIPEELKHIAEKLRTTDSYRRPEEVMETYYFVLQERLFDLFELLNKGKPNTNHKTIAKMAKENKFCAILTTNFDEFIEQALDEEEVNYKVICTNEEYKEYVDDGCEEFAVLKIHGTVSRPETIVAVASHYRTSGGFEGYKSVVAHHFIKNFPTLFFGYSGWDFVHSNYQEFWDAVGRAGGEKIYFLRLKESSGGPLLTKLVGRHVGDRLVIGEGTLPHTALSIWERFDAHSTENLLKFHEDCVVKGPKSIEKRHREFIKFWVQKIPTASLLAIMWNESIYLNVETNFRLEKSRERRVKKDSASSVMTTAETNRIIAYLMDLSSEFSQGMITNNLYLEKQKKATIELSLAPLIISKRKKEKIINLCADACKKNPVLIGSHDYQSLLPSYVLNIADVADDIATPIEFINEAIDYIVEVLEPLRMKKDKDEKSKILYELYHTQANLLRIPEEERKDIHELFEGFANDAIEKKWSEEEKRDRIVEHITPTVNRIAFHQIDTQAIIKSTVDHLIQLYEGADEPVENIIECSHILALSLYKQAKYIINDILKLDEVQKLLQMFGFDVNKKIQDTHYQKVEKKLSENTQPLLDLLNVIKKRRERCSHILPEEVLKTFELANTEILRLCLKKSSTLVADEHRRESCGYYPCDSLPPSAATYLSRKVLNAQKYIYDGRARQFCLGLLCVLGESSNDIKQMRAAVDKSMKLIDGKVAETSPYPIPEALAAQLQNRGDLGDALHYYKHALAGIRTFVPRQKTDSIVLNACLVQAQFDVEQALKMAFEFSPFFNEVQQHSIVSPARSILVQQCIAWASERGLSLDEAIEKLMNENIEKVDDDSGSASSGNTATTDITVESNENMIESGKEVQKSKSVTIEEPQEVEKKKKRRRKRVKIRKETIVQGLPMGCETQIVSSLKTRKAIQGVRTCENCVIM